MFHGIAAVLLGLVPAAPAQDGKDLVAYVEKLGGTAKQVVLLVQAMEKRWLGAFACTVHVLPASVVLRIKP